MEIPEWDIFKRIEKLEGIEPELGSVTKLSVVTFGLAFITLAERLGSGARWLKDEVVSMLKSQNLSKETIETLEKIMLETCENLEERSVSKKRKSG